MEFMMGMVLGKRVERKRVKYIYDVYKIVIIKYFHYHCFIVKIFSAD